MGDSFTITLLRIRPGSAFYDLYLDFIFLPLFIRIAVVITVVAVLATITAYVVILQRRWRGYRNERRQNVINPVIDELVLLHVILNEQHQQGVPVDKIEFPEEVLANPQLRKRWTRQVMIDRLIHYRKNLGGDTGLLLRKLYADMNLQKSSFDKINSLSWNKKVQGIVELTNMDISIADVTILPLTNSKRPELRTAARKAYVQLSKNEPFKFFDIATEPLLPWDQLDLFKIITTTSNISIPNFSRWVSYSSNKSIISFCLKLIAHYAQHAAIPAVIRLLETKDHYLRADAINCLGKLSAEEAEDKLAAIYSSQPLNCQLEILKALGRIGSGKYLEFLKHEFLYASDFDVRKAAAKSIIKHRSRSVAMVAELEKTVSEDNLLILKHVSNPLIKY